MDATFAEGAEELAFRGEEPAREPRFAPLPDDLDRRVREAAGVPRLYVHQRAAWDTARAGAHVIVATGTASGKTLAFNLPVVDALAPYGVKHIDMPATPLRVWEAIQAGRK